MLCYNQFLSLKIDYNFITHTSLLWKLISILMKHVLYGEKINNIWEMVVINIFVWRLPKNENNV